MGKMESKNNNISFQHCVKTVINALTALEDVQRKKNLRKSEIDTSHSAAFSSTELITGKGFKAMRNVKSLSLSFISSILITLCCLIGCSDMPYTGSVLTPDDIVDRYIVSPEKGKVCLQNGTDSACLLTLVPKRRVEVDGVSAPIIHIHPRKLTYVFYYNGKQIVHAERVMDTTEIVETLTEQLPTPDQSGGGNIANNGGNNGNSNNSGRTPLPPIPPPPPPPSRVPTTLAEVSGDGQRGEINQYLANPLIVKVQDQHGAVLSGVEVSFTVRPSSGVLSLVDATTGSNGKASTILQLGDTAGTYTVTASVSGIAQDVTFTATATDPPRPTALQKVSGDGQSSEINQNLVNPLVVRVLDQHGVALSDVTVSFTVRPSSGVLSPMSATTDSDGEASTILRLGSTAGTYTVTARVSGIPQNVSFTATATEPPPPPPPSLTPTALRKVSGDGQSGEINQNLTNPLVVKVMDQHGDALSGVEVSFTVSPNSGVLGSASATTGSNGETSTTLQLGATAGTYTVTASVSGIPQNVSFTATATEPPRPTTLELISGDGQSGEVNQNLANSLVVRILDQHSAVLSGITVNFSVNPSSGVLRPTSATTDANGEASTTLQLGSTAGTYTVTASVSGITQDVTFTATATDPPRPTTLEKVSGDSQSGEVNQNLANSLVVKVLDQHGAVLSGVTVSFSVSPTDGTLSPVSATTDANGEASTILQLGSTAGTYTVTASVSGITQDVSFAATATDPPPPPPPARVSTTLEKRRGDNQSSEAYQYLANPLVVRVLDQDDDALSGVEVSFTVNPSSSILGSATATTDANGEASTTLRFGKTTGTYTVTASVSNIAQSVTFTATATTRPTDSDWAQQSHYYDALQSKQGWLVWIYYPENYEGPMNTLEENDEANFLSNGFMLIPADGVTVTEFVQTEGSCYDADKPCHIGTVGDWENSTTYSVQVFLTMPEGTQPDDAVTFDVIWDRKAANWSDGSPPPDMTYTLMASKNMMSGQEGDDPDHTQQ